MDFGEVEDPVGLACPPLDMFFDMGDLESDSCLSGLGDLDGFFEEVGDDGNVKKQSFDQPKEQPKIVIRHRYGNFGKGKDIKNLFLEPQIIHKMEIEPIKQRRCGNSGKGKVLNCSNGQEMKQNLPKSIEDYDSKLEASKRKLRQGYEAADRAKRQRVIQVIKPRDMPNSSAKSCQATARFKTRKLQRLYENHKRGPGLY